MLENIFLHRMLENILCVLLSAIFGLLYLVCTSPPVCCTPTCSRVFSGVAFRFLFLCNVWMCLRLVRKVERERFKVAAKAAAF